MIVQLFNESNIIMNSLKWDTARDHHRIEFAIPTDIVLIRPHDKIKISIFHYSIIAMVDSLYMGQRETIVRAAIVGAPYLLPVHPDNPEIEEVGRKILNAAQNLGLLLTIRRG